MKYNRQERIMTLMTCENHSRIILGGEVKPYRYYRLFDQWITNGWFKYLDKKEYVEIWETFASGNRKERHASREAYLTLFKYVKLKKQCLEKQKIIENLKK